MQKRYFDTILESLQKEDAQGVILVRDEILTSFVENEDIMNALVDHHEADAADGFFDLSHGSNRDPALLPVYESVYQAANGA